MARPSWDTYFLWIARIVSSRSTCPRAEVGAVLTRDKRIIATGYNGSLSGEPHCLDVGCLLDKGGRHCQRAIHAETNAIAQAARLGIPVDGATLYYWDSRSRPADSCNKCWQLMMAAGIRRVVGVNYEFER